jgi:hypothetical protein
LNRGAERPPPFNPGDPMFRIVRICTVPAGTLAALSGHVTPAAA